MSFYHKLESLGIHLPKATAPAAAYLSYVRQGNLIFLAGHLARRNGEIWAGKLGVEIDVEQGRDAARAVAIDLIATLHHAIGDLDTLGRIVKLTSFVNSGSEFTLQHLVTNGASELLADVFGEKGRHARSAVGVSQLPLGSCVEIELIAEISN